MGMTFRSLTGAVIATLVLFLLVNAIGFGPSSAEAQSKLDDEAVQQKLRPVFSRDGTKLASAGSDGRILVLNLETGQELATFDGAGGGVTALAFSPDGNQLASAGDAAVTIWSLDETAEPMMWSVDSGRTITHLAFNPNGQDLAAVVDGVEIALWDLSEQALRSVLSNESHEIRGIAFSANGGLLAGFGSGPDVTLWDLAAGEGSATFTSPTGTPISGIAFSPAGQTLAAADEGFEVVLWDTQSGGQTLLSAHTDQVRQLRFSPDGATLASEGNDAQLLLWNVESGQDPAALTARLNKGVTGLAFSPDGATLANVGDNNEIQLWDVSSGRLLKVLVGHGDVVEEVAFGSPSGALASVDLGGKIIVWDLPSATERFAIQTAVATTPETAAEVPDAPSSSASSPERPTSTQAEASTANRASERMAAKTSANEDAKNFKKAINRIRALAVSADGADLAAVGDKGLMRFRVNPDADDSLSELSANALGSEFTDVTFNPSGTVLYGAGRNTKVHRWNFQTGKLIQELQAPEHPIRTVAVSNDGNLIASGGEETRIMVWSASGKLLRILSAHRDFVNSLAFSPSKPELASAGEDGRVFVWGASSNEPTQALFGHAGPVNALVYSNNGKILISGGSDSSVKIWNANNGRQLANLAHAAPVRALAISGNGKYLAVACDDTRVFLRDLDADGKLVGTLSGAPDLVASLAFLKSGRLVGGGDDGSLTLWDLKKGKIRSIKPTPLSQSDRMFEIPSPLDQGGEALASISQQNARGSLSKPPVDNPVVELLGRVLDWFVPVASAQQLPDPNQGPGGPILVIKSDSSLFDGYYAEILRAEGFNAFLVVEIGTVTQALLADYDLVVLAETPVTGAQVTMLTDWVNAGGNLIAMRPDPDLAGLLGLTASGPTLSEGYIGVDTAAAPGNGIVGETMQFHGTASGFTLNGATAVATLYSDATTATSNPAVTLHNVGSNGGQAAAFAYDLATSIVYTRQGNPDWANQERDGYSPQRSDDKYYGDAAADPQADWVDLNKVAIPQADEQQRLLANLIVEMTRDQTPLPRFWYFPRGEKAVVLMTGDDHANNGTEGRWNDFLAASPSGCSVEDWECVRGTSYIFPNFLLSNAKAVGYEAQGFEVGLHINTNCGDYTESELRNFYTQQFDQFATLWPGVPRPTTQRHHCIAWTDWVTGAKVQKEFGVRLDTSYYFWPPSWVENRPGFFNGSGLAMRFADLNGDLIDVYQAATQMTDESGQQYPYTIDTLLDRALGVEAYYGVYTINAHTDLAVIPESTATVASAKARGVPIITSRQLLKWLDGRDSSAFTAINWDGTTLSFGVTAGDGSNGLQALVPMHSATGVVNGVTQNGTPIAYSVVARKGIDYVAFAATSGSYQVSYGVDTTPPTVTAQTPATDATGVSRGTTVSVTFSEPMNASSISSGLLQLSGPGGPVAGALSYDAETRTATLTPGSAVAAEVTYTATLASGATDLAGNAIVGDISWSFTTAASSCPCTVWDSTAVPATASANDPNAVELGVKFRSESNGYITGIRFYKGSLNTGTHVGNLWSSAGALLATAIFANETATGWQQVDFATPVAINANTNYVASYHAPNGGYAINTNFFSASGLDRPPLHLLSDAESGGNGVYGYGGSGFPSQSWNASNYWVDVVFSDTGGSTPADTTPPTVTAFTVPDTADTLTVPITALSATDEVGVTGYLVTETASAPAAGDTGWTASAPTAYTFASAGSKTLYAWAKDAAGNVSASRSDSVTITLSDTTAPTVTAFTVPDTASTLTVPITAFSAADEVGVTGYLVNETASAPSAGASEWTASVPTSYTFASAGTKTLYAWAKDAAGNVSASLSASVTVEAGSGVCATPCSLWDATATPSVLAESDNNAVELGVKFRSSVDGFITGVRFYKSAQNTGTHVGKLWSSGGSLLAQATFVSETTSGWQEVSFASPVAIAANTVYVASYHAPVGRYSVDEGYFASARTNGPLSALATSDPNGPNGVYLYGAGGFPTNSFSASNYWVDVTFVTSTGPDTTPPTVTSTSPAAGATGVSVSAVVTAVFSEAMDAASITGTSFELRDASSTLVPAAVDYNAATRTATLTPAAALALGAQYTATVKGGASGVKDLADPANALVADVTWGFTTAATDPCSTGNAIVRENCLAGNPPSEWDISGAGDPSIQGFATDISVDRGGIVEFKIKTPASAYRLDIYRMGYYGGDGARKVDTVLPSATLPQNQPNCLTDSATGLIDCGNWAVSALWSVPANATSGIYFAKAIREDTGGASHIVFIVRDDTSNSDILFQTADTTWQAYNTWGGNSLYTGSGPGTGGSADGRAYKVSYNRPFNTRSVDGGQDWLFNAEYPMVRWLEANGFDVGYISGVDSDRYGNLPNLINRNVLFGHKLFLSVGHDEYWSAQQRANVEAARDAGVHLAFFSGNEVFWKTRWEQSIDGSGTNHRTLVCYKETHNYDNNPDPESGTWTGTWRDPRDGLKDGGQPENLLTGTIFTVNAGATTSIQVPAADGKMRFWRNTDIANLAAGTTASLPYGTLGYEWDEDMDNGFRPAGLVRMSTTTVDGAPVLTDFGSSFGSGTATHHLALYRDDSGALVFGAGTVQWSWGLDSNHDRGSSAPDSRMQQATVNLFADMGVQPATLQSGLVAATASTDTTAPTSAITSPAGGANLPLGQPVTVNGTATDAGSGVVGGVEVSVDGGSTWHPANGRASWSYTFTPMASGTLNIRTRAADDTANLETAGTGITITVGTVLDTQAPSIPEDLTVNVTTSTQVGLSWTASTDNVGVTGYRLERCQGADCSNFAEIATVTGTSYSNTGLTASTLYRYRVRAEDAAGNLSGYSSTAEATTQAVSDTELPSAPASLAATATGTSQIGLSWSASTDNVGVTGYRLERCQGAGCSNFAEITTVTGTSYSDTGLTASTLYRYRVRAEDAAGNRSAYSTVAETTTQAVSDTEAPSAPASLTATATGTSQIGLSWTASTDNVGVTGYRVERCTGAACSDFAEITTTTGTSYNDTGLSAGTTYRYQVRAADAAGNLSGYSAILDAATQAPDTEAPTAPTGLAATATSTSQIGLSWTASTDNVGVTEYRVERCTGAACSDFAEIATATATSYNDTGLTAGTTYRYRVRAADAAGNLSGYSAILDAATQAPAAAALQFSTLGNADPPGVAIPADDADVYGWDGTGFSRVLDASAVGVPTTAGVDGLSIEGGVYYVSFAGNVVIRDVTYQDEDILAYDPDTDTWDLYFDGTGRGLTASGHDIDDFDVVDEILYFSTAGNSNPQGVTGTADDADIYSWNGTSFARVLDVSTIGVPTAVTANVDGLSVRDGVYYLSFAQDVAIGGVTYQDEDILAYSPETGWSLYFDGTAAGLTANNQDISAFDEVNGVLYFSTTGNTDPPGIADDSDVYSWDGTSFARLLDASAIGVPAAVTANMDGLSIEGSVYYVSFTTDGVTIGGTTYQEEDILAYDPQSNTWSLYFDGTAAGLTAANQDIDDFDIVDGVLYFSTAGNTNPPGVSGTADDADIYSWNGTSFARVLDVSTIGVPTAANLDGLSVRDGIYYLSFAADVTIGGVAYQDEDILAYSPTTGWSLYFDGTAAGLTANSQDIDAVAVP